MDNLESLIASAVKNGAEYVGETGRKFAILGNQEGVVVDETTRPYNAMWVHIQGQEPFMAIDSSGQLTYDNTAGGREVEVEIGYPAGRQEGKDTPHILRITERGKQALGGITPAQMGLVRAQSPQAERLTTLRLTKGSSGLVVGMTGGWYMRGGYLDYAQPNDNIADLSSYVPSTTGYKKYVVVCWDGNQAVIEDRGEFDPASFIAPDEIKGTITPGCLRLGYALLEQGVAAWPDNDHVLPLPHLYNTEGLTTAAVAPDTTDDSDAGYSQHWRWLDTATGNIYYCTDASPGAAVWKLQSAGGAGGNVFESLYVQGTAYQHSFTNNQILQSAYSADAIGVLPIYAKARGTLASPGNVVQNDVISNTYWWAWHTSAWRSAAQETVTVIDASPSATSMQTKRAFLMTDSGSVTPTAVMDMTAARINFSVPLALPVLTTTQRDALAPSDGWLIYNDTTDKVQARMNGTWADVGGASSDDFTPILLIGW